MASLDLIGQRFGRLLVTRRGPRQVRTPTWCCTCECGSERVVQQHNLTSGRTRSCGCLHRETARVLKRRHGQATATERTSTYRIWVAMRQRCYNERHRSYANYGGRGISVCPRWWVFVYFLADMGERPSPLHSIDRINNDGNYEPDNCRWATRAVQNANQRRATRAA